MNQTLDQAASRRHWDENLDPQNLGAQVAGRNLRLEWDFYDSDEALWAEQQLPARPGGVFLELGAGLGTHALRLAVEGATVIAIDFSFARLKALRATAAQLGVADRLHCVQCAAEHLPFLDTQFSAIYTKSVLIHTRLPEALAEARRILRSGGKAVFIEPFGANPFAAFVRNVFAPQEWKAFTRYFDAWSAGEVARVFPRLQSRPYFLFGFLAFLWQYQWPHYRLFRFSLAITRWLDRIAFACIPPARRLAWFWVFAGEKE